MKPENLFLLDISKTLKDIAKELKQLNENIKDVTNGN